MKRILYLLVILYSCNGEHQNANKKTEENGISMRQYGTLPDGKIVNEYTLKNKNIVIKVINYGGIITSLTAPDRDGTIGNIVLGFNNLEDYLGDHPYFGALIGRYANRIEKARFTLDGVEYGMEANNGPNMLHGGDRGFHTRFWEITPEETDDGPSLFLKYNSKDMEEGFPGNVEAKVRYTLTDKNELIVNYSGTTDKPTVLNMTQHSYFNLSADRVKNILTHELTLNADKYLPVDENLIPTGELANVDNTPFDFRKPKAIGRDIESDHEQMKIGLGYDHCWVLKETSDSSLVEIAEVFDPSSGRTLTIHSTEPGVQFYSGNFLDGSLTGPEGEKYIYRYAFCLETEAYPNSPNTPSFPSPILRPGEKYYSKTIFKFGTK